MTNDNLTGDVRPNAGDGAADDGTLSLPLSKTPLFEATHAERYLRQQVIKSIQQDIGSPLICYVGGNGTSVVRDDVLPFEDLLCRLTPGSDLHLLLHTSGGDIDGARRKFDRHERHVRTWTDRPSD